MANPERGEVKLGNYTLKFSFRKLRELESELGVDSYGDIFLSIPKNLSLLTTVIAKGAGISEQQVDEIDIPIVDMVGPVLQALSLAIFGTLEPPKPPEDSDPT